MASVNVIGVPLAPVSDMPMVTVPVTVAPAAGLVNEAPSGDPTPPPLLLTVTPLVVVAVRPAPSRTVSPSVCGPSATVVVVHANVAVAALPEAVKTWPPSTVSVNVIGAPDAPASLMPMLTVPLTVALAAGLVNAAVSVGVVPFLMVTARVAVPV